MGDIQRATRDYKKAYFLDPDDFLYQDTMKEVVAELTLENRLLKKSMIGNGGDPECGTLHPRSWRSSGLSSNRIFRCAATVLANSPSGTRTPTVTVRILSGSIRH